MTARLSSGSARGLFVTGTDTGVGKTTVAALLCRRLREAGVDAVPMKPVQTGASRRGRRLAAPDLKTILAVARLAPAPAELECMAPYRFAPPVSPHLAARMARRRIRIARIVAAFERLAAAHEFVIVEGAGGVFVPLDGRNRMIDLAVKLGLPALVVARAGLGTINHTLLTVNALRGAGISVVGLVFNNAAQAVRGPSERENVSFIPRRANVPAIAVLPYCRHGESMLRRGEIPAPLAGAFPGWPVLRGMLHRDGPN